ncbi:TetR/AcrR family transcriptional regulator [Pseudonocardiaceae bacterium YIM PH 21723]|nr:TetR/AcrR family transcriptional regulator [Pseudonocardiaceae bacterium YIM PH 21723]
MKDTETTGKRQRATALPPEERKKAIVEATIPLLFDHGASVTTKQIAEAAGIAEGTIFRVFEDKLDLIGACMNKLFASTKGADELRKIPLDQPLPDRLEQAITQLAEGGQKFQKLMESIGPLMHQLHERAHAGKDNSIKPPDRARTLQLMGEAAADLFRPETDRLRVSPEKLGTIFVGLAFMSAFQRGTDHAMTSQDLISVLLDGALTGEEA